MGILKQSGGRLRPGRPRELARALSTYRHRARARRSPLDRNGVIAAALTRDPLHAMDVGAAGGVSAHWRDHLPVMQVDCFEPDAAECAVLQASSPANIHWFPIALAGATGRRQFYVLNRATGSSLYPPNDPVIMEFSGRSYAGVRRVLPVYCLSLADFLHEHRRPVPALMKLDTQGTELEILSSLTPTQLSSVLAVEMEVEFLELYKGQPTFGEIHAFMQASGFRLLDLRTHRSYRNAEDEPQHYLRRHLRTATGSSALGAELVAGDALYIREPALEADAGSTATLLKYLCILRMYSFYDLAFWTAEQAERRGLITPSQHSALVRDLAYGAPRPRLQQRPGMVGDMTRTLLSVLAYDDHEVFWTRRNWPDQ